MKNITLKQLQERLLTIAASVDQICQKNNIPLYMTVGTMLGAVRHKGFIPWDDDMDFAVPYQYFPLLKKLLRQELPDNLRLISYEDSGSYISPWIKVEDKESIVIDKCLDLPIDQMPGLTIDIFPLVKCCKCSKNNRILNKISLNILILRHLKSRGIFKSLVTKRLNHVFLNTRITICSRIMKLCDQIVEGNYYINPVDPVYKDKYFPIQWFQPQTRFEFENKKFVGVAEYDKYLTEVYHNYMQLPPEDKRRVHVDSVFIK